MIDIQDHLNLWKKKEPWFYSDRIFNAYVYYLISSIIISLTIATLIVSPISSVIVACILGYWLAQFIFQFGHMTTHALYIESPPEEWEPGVMVAWLHHYENPKAIYEHWLIHRLNFIMQTKGCTIAYFAAWLIPFVLFGSSLGLLYVWFLFWFNMVEPVHEWYHVPKSIRKAHFSAPMYYWLSLLGRIGILDEKGHIEHHRHTAKDMDKVSKFSDLYSPFADLLFNRLWANALIAKDRKLFKTNPIRKTVYAQGVVLIPLAFSLSSWVFFWTNS